VTASLTCRIVESDGETILSVAGEIDQSNAATVATNLTTAVARAGDARLIVDLTAVEYLDSAGLAVLFPHADHIRIRATPLLGPVLTISGLADLSPTDGI